MNDRAELLIRCLRLECANRELKAALRHKYLSKSSEVQTARIVELHDQEGLQWTEIAKRVGISVQAVRARYARALEAQEAERMTA